MAYDPNNAVQPDYAQRPIYGANDLITGYTNESSVSSPTRSYSTTSKNLNSPALNSNGQWVVPATGLPAHGAFTGANGTPSYYSNGKQVSSAADVGVQTPSFTETTTAKQPQINSAADSALASETSTANSNQKSFSDYLAQAKALNAQGAQQLTKDQAAVDPTATIARVNKDVANTTSALDQANRTYQTEQQGVQDQIAAENSTAADKRDTAVGDLQSKLDADNQAYETASQAVAGQAFQQAQKNISLYQLGTGTPASASGDVSNRLIRAYTDINIPLQQDLAARRYQQTGQIYGEQKQADAQRYGDLINQYGSQAALNTDVTNRDTDTTKYTGNLDSTTAQYIQQLQDATAGMSRAQAASYLQQLSVPFEIGQALVSGNIQALSGIQNLYNGANWYDVSKPYDGSNVPGAAAPAVRSPTRIYTPQPAGAADTGQTAGTGTNGGTTPGNSSPTGNVLPSGKWAATLKPAGGNSYQDPKTGSYYTLQNGQLYPYVMEGAQAAGDGGTQANDNNGRGYA